MTLPPVMLPVVVIALAPAAIIPMTLPALKLPVVAILPEPVFNVPATLTPVPVTTTTLATPTADMLTLPLAAGILTLLFPFASGPMILPALKLPVVEILPAPMFNVPATLIPVPVIVNVVLPAAAIVTLPFAVPKNTLLLPLANVPIMLPPKKLLPAPTNIA